MAKIFYIDRNSCKRELERVYGIFFLEILYGERPFQRFLSAILRPLFTKVPFFSHAFGWFQKRRLTKRKVLRFIEKYEVDASEFLETPSSYRSFNDFFIRKLKPECRPVVQDPKIAVLPADGRYLAYQNYAECEGIFVKGKRFSLEKLLGDGELAKKYERGSLMIARLSPVDYHRFHFPCDGVPGAVQKIKGSLYSVNPIALRKNIEIFQENKRMITRFETKEFGTILYIEVGATYVGTIHQTFTPGKEVKKGAEKGYFSFGGSSLILLFEPGKIALDKDLLEATKKGFETRSVYGQSLGSSRQIGQS